MNNLTFLHIVLIYLVVVNAGTFIMYGIDKFKARHSKWRVPETTLLGMAVVGGSVGAWLGMSVWHHKTLHKKFKYGVPLILILQIVLVVLTSCGTQRKIETITPVSHRYVPEHSPSTFLVMYDEAIGKEPLLKAIKDYGVEIIYDYHIINGMALKKPDDKSLEETMEYFKKVKGVVSVEYDQIYHLTDPVKPKLDNK